MGDTDFGITKQVDQATAEPGDTLLYTLTVTNPSTTGGVPATITDILPSGVTYVSSSHAFNQAGQVLTLNFFFPAGTTIIMITVTVNDDVPDGTLLLNTATVVGGDPDTINTANNTATALTTVDFAAVVPVPPRARARIQQLTYASDCSQCPCHTKCVRDKPYCGKCGRIHKCSICLCDQYTCTNMNCGVCAK